MLHYAVDERSPLGVDHARYAESMIALNRIKTSLLAGALRAGPEKPDTGVPTTVGSSPSAPTG